MIQDSKPYAADAEAESVSKNAARVATVRGCDVYVGNVRACYEPWAASAARLHVWSHDKSPPLWPCIVPADALNFRIEWLDGGALQPADLDKIVAWVNALPDDTPILVHCASGQCRSSTLATVVLGVLTGIHPVEHISAIYQGLLDQRGIVADIRLAAIDSIAKWWAERNR